MMKMFSLCSSGGVSLPLLLLLFILLSSCCCDGHRHVNDTSRSKGVYICITGQLARLELKNKIERLLLPLHSLGFDLYIALALHNSTHYSSNNNNGDNMRLVPSLDHAMSVLRGVDGVKEVMHYPLKHPENMHVNKKYLNTLSKKKIESRVQNHARQYQSLQFCNQWPLINNLTQVTVRVREDILFEMSNMSEILAIVEQGKVVTPACDSWRGINDKVAFLPSSLAHPFFHYPYERYHTFNTHINRFNSEQFYHFVYKEQHLDMQSTSSLYVSKAIVSRLSLSRGNQSLCWVSGLPHHICNQPGCDLSVFENTSGVMCRQAKVKSDGIPYQTECW